MPATRFNLFGSSLFSLCLLLLTGCGSSDNPSGGQTGGGAETPPPLQVRKIAVDTLPVGDPLGHVDGGRIEISTPQEWSPHARGSSLARFRLNSLNQFPRILVTASEDDWSQLQQVTEDNVVHFAETLQRKLDADEKIKLIEPVIPMMLGEIGVGRYVRQTKLKSEKKTVLVERQILVTVRDGRAIQIDLQTPLGRIPAYRDAGYAVAASLRFPGSGESKPKEAEGGDSQEGSESLKP